MSVFNFVLKNQQSHLCVLELHCDCFIHHNYQFKSTIQPKLDLSQQF